MTSDKLIIRDFCDQDKNRIMTLFKKVFKEELNGEVYEWQFKQHVYGTAWVGIVESDNEVIGHQGLLKQYLNYKGGKILGALTMDAMIKQDQQGTGIMSNLTKYLYKRISLDGAQFAIGFGSRNPYPASYVLGIKYFGWNYITNLKQYTMRIGYKKILQTIGDKLYKQGYQSFYKIKNKLKGTSIGKGIKVETTKHLPDELEYSLQNIRDFEVLAVWKDLDYLRWRYEKHPKNNYLFHVLWNRGKAEGLVVTRDCGYNIAICEVLHSKKNIKKTAYLLRETLRYYYTKPAQIMEFFGHDNGFYDAVFEEAGFKNLHYSPIIFVGKIFGEQKFDKHFGAVQNWSIAYGDTDVI